MDTKCTLRVCADRASATNALMPMMYRYAEIWVVEKLQTKQKVLESQGQLVQQGSITACTCCLSWWQASGRVAVQCHVRCVAVDSIASVAASLGYETKHRALRIYATPYSSMFLSMGNYIVIKQDSSKIYATTVGCGQRCPAQCTAIGVPQSALGYRGCNTCNVVTTELGRSVLKCLWKGCMCLRTRAVMNFSRQLCMVVMRHAHTRCELWSMHRHTQRHTVTDLVAIG